MVRSRAYALIFTVISLVTTVTGCKPSAVPASTATVTAQPTIGHTNTFTTPSPTPSITPSGTSTPPPSTTSVPPPATSTSPATTSAPPSPGAVILFDFDSGTPVPTIGRPTPFFTTIAGLTAQFSSPSDPAAFSIQNRDTTAFLLSQFSGNYINDNNQFRNSFTIKFSHGITSISFVFATVEYHGVGNVDNPSILKLTAYRDSAGGTSVGTATAKGIITNDIFPQGILTFDSGAQAFTYVVIELLPQPGGGANYLIDTVQVKVATNP